MNVFCDIDLELFCVEIVWCLHTFLCFTRRSVLGKKYASKTNH